MPAGWLDERIGAGAGIVAFLEAMFDGLLTEAMDGALTKLESVLGRREVAGVLASDAFAEGMDGGPRLDADVADKLECTSVDASCLPRDEIAQPARAPAAPAAEFTKPAWPTPFVIAVVVIGP